MLRASLAQSLRLQVLIAEIESRKVSVAMGALASLVSVSVFKTDVGLFVGSWEGSIPLRPRHRLSRYIHFLFLETSKIGVVNLTTGFGRPESLR